MSIQTLTIIDKHFIARVFPATNLLNRLDDKPIQNLIYHIHFFNKARGNNPDYTFTSFPKVKTS